MRPSRCASQVKRQSRYEEFEQRLALSVQAIGNTLLDDDFGQQVEHHYGELTPAESLETAVDSADFVLDSELEQRVDPQLGELNSHLADVHDITGVNYVYNNFGFGGAGQTVAIVDSGLAYDHFALGGGFGSSYRVVGGYDFAEDDGDPYDDGPAGFHGSHVAGIVGSDNSTYRGVAPGSDLVALRVFDDNGAGYFSWVESALQWVHDHRNDFANPITTVNLSLGTSWNSDSIPSWATLEDEFAQLKADGIFIAVSAGNSFAQYNSEGLSYPAASPYVVPVASVDNSGAMSSFSQRHSRVLAAPGRSITSTVPDHVFGADGVPNDFGTASGTSMAAPYAAGASVLVRQAMEFNGQQSINQDAIYDHLRDTADVFYDPATNANYHRINVRAALDALMPDDDYGSTAAVAHSLGTVGGNTSFAGTIGTLTDSDYFTFTAGSSGTLTFSTTVTHALTPTWDLVGGGGQANGSQGFSLDVIQGQSYTFGLGSSDGLGHYTINVVVESNQPFLTTSSSALSYRENDPSVAIDSALQLTGGTTAASANYTATVQIVGNYQATQDVISFSDTAQIQGTVTGDTLTLQVASGQTASLADFQSALRSVKYHNTSDDPTVQSRTVTFSFNDGTSSTTANRQIDLIGVNDAPLLTTSGTALSYTEQAQPTAVDPSVSIADVDSQGASSSYQASVRISANFAAGQDVLSFTDTAKIKGSVSGDTLSLTVVSGQTATIAEFTTALRSVTYHNSSSDPSTSARTVTFSFSDGSLTASATRGINVVAVANTVQIIDNGESGFTTTGSWSMFSGQGRSDDIHFSAAGSGADVARWTFDVSPGVYRVSSTWHTHQNRATDAPYTVYSGSQMAGQVDLNQEFLVGDLVDSGSTWQDLGQFNITGNSLVVALSDQANEYVIADAVRIERVGDAVLSPEIEVLDGTTSLSDDGTVNFGSTTPGAAVDKVFTVKNVGTQNLTLSPLSSSSFPTGFSLLQNLGSTSLDPGGSTTFTVRMQSDSDANLSGGIALTNNDSDENPFNLTLSGTVASDPSLPAVQILDNGAAGFTTSGSWSGFSGQGRGNAIHFSAAGSGADVARWSFDVSPGIYRVSGTWHTHQNRATDAPFRILDGSTQVGQVDVNQESLLSHRADAGSTWQDFGQFDISGTTLVVELSDQANEYVIADAVRIERLGDLVLAPEIEVLDGTTSVSDGSTLSFGSTLPGTAVDKVLTVKNVGNQDLTLTALDSSTLPTGFSLIQNFGNTTLTAGASTTLTLRLQSSNESSFGGAISFATNDSDENPFDLTLSGTVASAPPPPAVQIVDNGGAGFSTTGSWSLFSGQGRGNDIHFSAAGSGADVARWTFDVSPGIYRVSSTWHTHQNRATDAPFTVYSGSTAVGQLDVNQEQLTGNLVNDGSTWQDLGQFSIVNDTLVVALSDQANEYVIADAIRVERIGDVVMAPEIEVMEGTTSVSDNGTVDFGSTLPGQAMDKTLTVKNTGLDTLTLNPLDASSLPSGFSLVENFGSTSLAPGASTTFSLRLQSSSEGQMSGGISFTNNDSDEGTFNLTLQGTVASTPPPPAVQIIDDGDAGFATIGSWSQFPGQGRGNDIRFSPAGNGTSVASWTFDTSPGVYRVSSTWHAHPNRATDSPFTIMDGNRLVTQLDVNQEQLTSDIIDAGSNWQDLGQFDISGSTLVVQLNNQANEYVIADAVRIERLSSAQGYELDNQTDGKPEPSSASPARLRAFAVQQLVHSGFPGTQSRALSHQMQVELHEAPHTPGTRLEAVDSFFHRQEPERNVRDELQAAARRATLQRISNDRPGEALRPEFTAVDRLFDQFEALDEAF